MLWRNKMSIETEKMSLSTRIPIDLSVPKPYLRAYVHMNKDYYTRVFKIDEQLYVCRVTQEKPLTTELLMKIESDDSIKSNHRTELVDRIRFELGLDEKMTMLKKIARNDRSFRKKLHQFPGFRLFANSNIYEAAVLTLISQNTTYPDYLAIVNNFMHRYGEEVPWDTTLRVFPANHIFDTIGLAEWRDMKAVMNARYLAELNSDLLELIETYTFYPIFERGIKGLRSIKGISTYMSRMLMIYTARRYGIAPHTQEIKDIMERVAGKKLATVYQFDTWINSKYPKDPALFIHAYVLDNIPIYRREYDFDSKYALQYLQN